MKLLLLLIIALFSTSILSSNKIPRQKISLTGLTKSSDQIDVSVADIEKLKKDVIFDLHDPYNKDIKTHFTNISFETLIKIYAGKTAKSMFIKAIDGYSVEIKIEDAIKIPLYLAYKDENGYLTIDRMGPLRIIEKRDQKINKELLAKIGVNWVWQIKSIEFK